MAIKRDIIQYLDKGEWYGLVSLDLSSAFDVVNHELLIKRLRIMGIPQTIVNLIQNWLTDRSFYVEINGHCSEARRLAHGTIQGSVLGPILFALFVAPLLQREDINIYADDNYVGENGKSLEEVIFKLQIKVKRIANWLADSGLKVNLLKTEFVMFHNKVKLKEKSKLKQLKLVRKLQ